MALFSLHQSEAFSCLSFVGGTALRFLFGLQRFSEDLDFSLESSDSYEPAKWLGKLKRDLEFMGFVPEITWNDNRVVHTGWIKFSHLLKEAGLGALPSQKLSIKLEIDSKPPSGAKTETKVVNLHRLMSLRHHSLPCLMAGKVRAVLTRPFHKGRDWYDLMWYLSRRPPVQPDLAFLQASLSQGPEGDSMAGKDWKNLLARKLSGLKAKDLLKDVAPFLEHPEDGRLLEPEKLRQALGNIA
jgi:predicted nucleotidyltransferase component of viral defense system